MIIEGLSLMLSGTGIVFAFLVILVFAVSMMSQVIIQIENRTKRKQSENSPQEALAALTVLVLHDQEIQKKKREALP